MYTKIPITDILNKTIDYVNTDDQFTKKTNAPQDNFLDAFNLVLTTTWYIFNFQFYQQPDDVAMGRPVSSLTAEIYIQAQDQTVTPTTLHPSKLWEEFVDEVSFFLKRRQLEKVFPSHQQSTSKHELYYGVTK